MTLHHWERKIYGCAGCLRSRGEGKGLTPGTQYLQTGIETKPDAANLRLSLRAKDVASLRSKPGIWPSP